MRPIYAYPALYGAGFGMAAVFTEDPHERMQALRVVIIALGLLVAAWAGAEREMSFGDQGAALARRLYRGGPGREPRAASAAPLAFPRVRRHWRTFVGWWRRLTGRVRP